MRVKYTHFVSGYQTVFFTVDLEKEKVLFAKDNEERQSMGCHLIDWEDWLYDSVCELGYTECTENIDIDNIDHQEWEVVEDV